MLMLALACAPLLAPAASIAAPTTASAPEQVADPIVLTNATILTGDGQRIDGGSILIERGKITRVEATAITGIAEATTVDLGGKLVTPGLIAADTEIGLVEIGAEDSTHDDARNDQNGAVRAGYDPASAINADSSLIAVQAIEGVTTAAVAPRGGLFSGEVAWIDLLPGDHTNIVARDRVAVAANFGRSVAGSRAATLTELRKAFEDAQWYRQNQRDHDRGQARELVAHPLDLRALWPVLDKQVPLVVRAHRASDLLALCELGSELGIRITAVGATEAWKVRDQLAAAKIVVVIQPSHNLPGNFDTLGARLDNAALLHEAGVTVAIAHFDSHNARNITQEAGIAIANGLPRDAALAAVTVNVARAYGMEAEYGIIATGKVASLVVWDGTDPFELSTWAEQVYVRGRKLDMRSRQTELRDRYTDLSRF
ncbi:MAG TPA: amidohydrolase family protein [Enhygromyxa sp.]|nr:amidohydrolase family protein [Enhygromyxa sp.]